MQNWILVIRKRLSANFFKYSAQVSVFILVAFTIMSFTPDNSKIISTDNLSFKDSTDTTKGFVSLLSGSSSSNSVSFEINSRAMPFVKDFIKQNGNKFENMKVWGKPYFILYENILSQYGLPKELEYLSVVESDLQSTCISCAGAVGPWQMMPAEAHRWGLKTGGRYDERTDFTKSTHAAAKLLKTLYGEYGDWLLVIAAYNAGPGGVDKAIKRAGSTDFWTLQYYLPAETQRHVKKFIATHYYFEGTGGWTTMTAREAKFKQTEINNPYTIESAKTQNTATIEISGRYNSVVIANALMIEITLLNHLNPQLDQQLAEGKPYQLRLPNDKIELFRAKKQDILKESVQLLLSSSAMNPASKQLL
ncbi:MAG: lytic transglycosylase domain-containing protein [Parafilimonas sp.]